MYRKAFSVNKALVLIVDDNHLIRSSFQSLLNNAGFETVTASDGAAAIRNFSTTQPDMVLLDMDLPAKDGCSTCREIRSLPEGRHVPVIMLTSLSETGLVHRAFEAGATDFVHKSINPELLIYRVSYMLRAGWSMASLAESEALLANSQRIAQLGSWDWNPSTGKFKGSAELFRVLGVARSATSFSYENFLSSIIPADREKVHSALQNVSINRAACKLECRLQKSGPQISFVRIHGQPHVMYSGEKPRVVGTLQDITEMKQAEERLRMLNAAVDCLPIGITISDIQGVIAYSNPAEAEIHGYTIEELIGREARRFASEDLGKVISPQELVNSGAWRRDSINVRKNGDEFAVQLTSIPVKDSDGAFLGMVTACEDITARKEAEAKIHHLAYYDTLTGLPNRRMFMDRLQQALAMTCREGGELGLLFLDLDNFKDVNDTMGHHLGDILLQEVTERLAANKREYEVLARLGGDEFVVILAPIVSQESIAVVAERMLSNFSRPFVLDSRQVYSSASIGIAVYPRDAKDVETLVKCADTAMYYAKSEGKSRYRFFSAELNERVLCRVALENGLRQAVAKQELYLLYQPQWEVESERMTGVEALLRWESEEFGLVQPAEFISLAEDIGLISELGEWVLRSACLQVKKWLTAGTVDIRMAVNVSVKQLTQPGFVEMVRAIVVETGVSPELLDLEFTESVVMGNADKTIDTLKALKEMGFRLSIDDFGTGYSSLSYLKRLPVDRIKIDRSFIKNVNHSSDDAAIVEAIISMAHSLNLKVVAEGIENSEQLHFLTSHNCDEVQGFYLAMPMDAMDLGGNFFRAPVKNNVALLRQPAPLTNRQFESAVRFMAQG